MWNGFLKLNFEVAGFHSEKWAAEKSMMDTYKIVSGTERRKGISCLQFIFSEKSRLLVETFDSYKFGGFFQEDMFFLIVSG